MLIKIVRLTAILVLMSVFRHAAAAQRSTSAPSSDTSATTQQRPDASQPDPPPIQKAPDKTNDQAKTSGEGSASGTSNDRLFFTLPNFLTLENAGHVPPLTTKQKYAVVLRSNFDYVQYPWYAFLSGISQAENSEPGYGQGWQGYGKRYGAALADGTIENFMTGAILPSLLHQDPRYFQSGHGSFTHRMFYSMSRNLITRADSGKNEFNYSEVLGGAISAA